MKARPRLIAVFSDLHAGSTVALLPPGFETIEGNRIEQTPLQAWLWECWSDAQAKLAAIAGTDPYALVLNGDLIEGTHHGTKQIISPDIGDHVAAALEIIRPLHAKAARTLIVRGTECHTGNAEHAIAQALKLPDAARDRLTIDIAGIRCVFRHHIGTTTRRGLSGTQLSMQLAEEQLEAACNGEPLPRVLCCAHRHVFGQYKDNKGLCVVSPPWQGLSRFAHKVVSQARTKPGLFILDWRHVPDGELPIVHARTYDTPHPEAIAL